MNYETTATSTTPAFVIYLIDLSASMSDLCGGRQRIDIVGAALERTKRLMIRRSRRGEIVRPRYYVAMYGYHSTVIDLLGGVKTIEELSGSDRIPALDVNGSTNMYAGFDEVRRMLQHNMPNASDSPAPLVCHLTDGAWNIGGDPKPVVDEIRQMGNDDGNVLVENIFIGDRLLRSPINDAKTWCGVTDASEIEDQAVAQLVAMSSPLPASYAAGMGEFGYSMRPGVPMLIPAETPELIDLAFTLSSSTPTGR